jgi:hypothetical protein
MYGGSLEVYRPVASHAKGRGFDPRLPLHKWINELALSYGNKSGQLGDSCHIQPVFGE